MTLKAVQEGVELTPASIEPCRDVFGFIKKVIYQGVSNVVLRV